MGGGSRAEDSHAEPRRRGGGGQLGAMVICLPGERDGDGLATENTKKTKETASFQGDFVHGHWSSPPTRFLSLCSLCSLWLKIPLPQSPIHGSAAGRCQGFAVKSFYFSGRGRIVNGCSFFSCAAPFRSAPPIFVQAPNCQTDNLTRRRGAAEEGRGEPQKQQRSTNGQKGKAIGHPNHQTT